MDETRRIDERPIRHSFETDRWSFDLLAKIYRRLAVPRKIAVSQTSVQVAVTETGTTLQEIAP